LHCNNKESNEETHHKDLCDRTAARNERRGHRTKCGRIVSRFQRERRRWRSKFRYFRGSGKFGQSRDRRGVVQQRARHGHVRVFEFVGQLGLVERIRHGVQFKRIKLRHFGQLGWFQQFRDWF